VSLSTFATWRYHRIVTSADYLSCIYADAERSREADASNYTFESVLTVVLVFMQDPLK